MLTNRDRNEDPKNVKRVRAFRKEAGASEQVMWAILRGGRLGFKFRRQHPVGPYALDFYCAEAMLCIEVDGELHATRSEADRRRDAFLLERRILTVRVPSLHLFVDHPAQAENLRHIVRLCEERSGRAAFPNSGS